MKHILPLFLVLISYTSWSQIIYNDIPDFTFEPFSFSSLDIDFDNDGITDFTFFEQIGGIFTIVEPEKINFFVKGVEIGEREIIIPFAKDAIISNTGYDGVFDVYINANFGDSDDYFPEGDSYAGFKFKKEDEWFLGWFRINSNNGVLSILDYAYNSTPNLEIKAGEIEETLSVDKVNLSKSINVYPNPVLSGASITIPTSHKVKEVSFVNSIGQKILVKTNNNKVNTTSLKTGGYVLMYTINKKVFLQKIIIIQ